MKSIIVGIILMGAGLLRATMLYICWNSINQLFGIKDISFLQSLLIVIFYRIWRIKLNFKL